MSETTDRQTGPEAAPESSVVDTTGVALRAQATEAAAKAGQYAERVGDAVQQAGAATGRMAGQVAQRLRNNAELVAERGSTTIANEVVEKIAGIAARDVPGVHDLGGDVARIFSAVKEKIGFGEASEQNQGVRVKLEGRSAAIDVTIVIEFGFVVFSVTDKVREKVFSAVENLLGLEVTEVNIIVDDVHVPEHDPAASDESRAAGYQTSTPGIVVG